jgi:hypothetical protein
VLGDTLQHRLDDAEAGSRPQARREGESATTRQHQRGHSAGGSHRERFVVVRDHQRVMSVCSTVAVSALQAKSSLMAPVIHYEPATARPY